MRRRASFIVSRPATPVGVSGDLERRQSLPLRIHVPKFALLLAVMFLAIVFPLTDVVPMGGGGAEVAAAESADGPVAGDVIWDLSRVPDREKTRMEFPDLIRFQGDWYCSFREGEIHGNHPTGRGRVIRSSDGVEWQTAALMEWDGGDVRDPRLSVTADGHLMLNSSIYFTSRGGRGTPSNESEAEGVARQSVTWFSGDGETWTSVYACPTGVNTWRWDVKWNGGMGYSVGYAGKDGKGTLYRTRDGKIWRALLSDFFPEGRGNEAAFAFADDNTACCLLRGGIHKAMIGVGTPPDYQEWQWKGATLDWQGNGELQPVDDVWRGSVGGPKIICLEDGRFLGIGRLDGRVTLFWVDPETAVLTKFVEVAGTSYPGLVEHEGQLWVTYGVGAASSIQLVKVPVPK